MSSKRYLAKMAGSSFIFSDGTQGLFAYGFLDVGPDKFPGDYEMPAAASASRHNGRPRYLVYQDELNAIIGKNPNIFVAPINPKDKIVIEAQPVVPQNALSEREVAESERVLKLSGVQTVTKEEMGASNTVPDPMASTIDPDIARAMLSSRAPEIGPGAGKSSKLEEIRAAAAANIGAAPSTSGN